MCSIPLTASVDPHRSTRNNLYDTNIGLESVGSDRVVYSAAKIAVQVYAAGLWSRLSLCVILISRSLSLDQHDSLLCNVSRSAQIVGPLHIRQAILVLHARTWLLLGVSMGIRTVLNWH